jgi:uncharacterized membrane protein YdfJ with MMPL/SSD domain
MMSQWQLPAIVLTIVTWLTAPSLSLGDLSRREALRREMTPKSAHALVSDDLPPAMAAPVSVPVSLTPPGEATPPAAAGADQAKHDEKWWRDQMGQARQALDRDRMLAESVQGRINSLSTDFVNRDDPAQRAVVEINRQKAIAELDRLQKQITADEKAIAAIQQDAHRQGIPPGWIR